MLTGRRAARRPVTWVETMDRGLRRVLLALCLVNTMGGSGMAVGVLRAGPAAAWIGFAVVLAAQVAMMVLIALRSPPGSWMFGLIIVSVLGAAVSLRLSSFEGQHFDWWPLPLLLTAVCFMVYLSRSARSLVAVVGLLAVAMSGRAGSWPAGASPAALLTEQAIMAGQVALMATTTYLAATALLDAADAADRSLDFAAMQRAHARRAARRALDARRVDRFIHDEVLHTLRAIALDRAVVPARLAVEAAGHLLGELTGQAAIPAEESRLSSVLDDACAASGLAVTRLGLADVVVPNHVAEAFGMAVREALRNVARHAAVDDATLRVERSGLQVSVTVTDRGAGFDPRGLPARSRGVRSSIITQMRDVGGDARVRSEPGRGTTVRLAWAAGDLGSTEHRAGVAGGAVSELFPAAALVIMPQLLINVWAAAWLAPRLTHPWIGWCASLAVVSVGTHALVRAIRYGMSRVAATGVALLAWGASAANGLTLPPDTANAATYWLAGGAASLGLLLAYFRPWREFAVCGVGSVLVALVCIARVRVAPEVLIPSFLPAALSPVLALAAGHVLRRTVDVLAWDVMAAQEQAVVSMAELEQRLHIAGLARQRMRERADMVVTFVREVAEGATDVTDSSTRRLAEQLERAIRDQVLSSAPPRVVAWVQRLSMPTDEVVMRLSPGMPQRVEQVLCRLFEQLGLPSSAAAGLRLLQVTGLDVMGSWRLGVRIATEAGAAPAMPADLLRWTRQEIGNELLLSCLVPEKDDWPGAEKDPRMPR